MGVSNRFEAQASSLEVNDLFISPGPGLHEADAIEIARRSSSFKLFWICRMILMDWLSIQHNNVNANADLLRPL